MSIDPPPTPAQARELLVASGSQPLGSTRDRRVHAARTAAVGVMITVGMTTGDLVPATANVVITAVWLAIWIATQRAIRTVPRRGYLWTGVGVGTSFVLTMTVAMPWLNLQLRHGPRTWPMALTAGLLAAVPSLLAAVVIWKDRR